MIEALDIQVRGIVQGVGFRPFVYRLAKKYLINGWVLNGIEGVSIHAEGEAKHLDEFVIEIAENPPTASQVDEVELHEVPLQHFESFEIRFSDEGETEKTTLVSPDLATCEECARELFDPNDRRYRYPFINCTNCGPRFTIIDELPYDRAKTSMHDFPMCELCQSEYEDPLDRRFHAQPDACFTCGPQISWYKAGDSISQVKWGTTRKASDEIIVEAVEQLRQGAIIAVKGLGGFHLVCDAENEVAVAALRRRKRREGKPFAVMLKDAAAVKQYCLLNHAEQELLSGVERPIVLLKKKDQVSFVSGLADGLSELGVMLPYTPIQHLLINDFTGMLVMTSGNLHDEPIVTDDQEAYRVLADVADYFLGHNRAIASRYDDSVARVICVSGCDIEARATSQELMTGKYDTAPSTKKVDAVSERKIPQYSIQFIRRARGYSPLPIDMKASVNFESVFATGPEQKNTFCITRAAEAFVSQHIGDLENVETFDAWLETKKRYEQLFHVVPKQIACDMHPEYLTSKWAHDQDLPVIEVQHHHAHIVSVMVENDLEEPVAGIAFDGTGYGVDGAIWGGEVLLCNRSAFERFINFAYVPMPGGAAAIKNPLRMAYGVLWAFGLLEHPTAQTIMKKLGKTAEVCERMIEQGINSPYTSSVGRLFDAASALLGICTDPKYEGEGAILLEAAIQQERNAIDEETRKRYHIELVKNTATATSTAQDTSVLLLDAEPVFKALLDDMQANVPAGVIARSFHNAFVEAIVTISQTVYAAYEINTIALSGGVFMNRYLIEHALASLAENGFTVAINQNLPPNDGCISFGQAVIACTEKQDG